MTNKEAIELLKKATMFEPKLENRDYPEAFDLAIKALEERPQGEWIVDEDDDILKPLKCSNCGEVAECLDGGSQFLSNFCPNCGADMRGGAEC